MYLECGISVICNSKNYQIFNFGIFLVPHSDHMTLNTISMVHLGVPMKHVDVNRTLHVDFSSTWELRCPSLHSFKLGHTDVLLFRCNIDESIMMSLGVKYLFSKSLGCITFAWKVPRD